ncbi:MAG: mannose-6-phosphate isomerase [Rubritepida sp.]|nr:mannose-6-phosphate isomerase [Rubritepida sp.]
MTIERAAQRTVGKPWGRTDLRPWSMLGQEATPTGEIWFERSLVDASEPALLIKLLFTSAALSIQVHPDDRFARSIGLPHGKSEAWYVLSATPGARVALGLHHAIDAIHLRRAIADGSIVTIVDWRSVQAGDFLAVPAGTIHAIGANLVIAEIQQRSDATFRLFDFDRHRELQIDCGMAASHAAPAEPQPRPSRLSASRMLLAADPHFIVEKIDLLPMSVWRLEASQETWLLVIGGGARLGELAVVPGEAVFLDAEVVDVQAGAEGLQALVAYPGPTLASELLEGVAAGDLDAGLVRLAGAAS